MSTIVFLDVDGTLETGSRWTPTGDSSSLSGDSGGVDRNGHGRLNLA